MSKKGFRETVVRRAAREVSATVVVVSDWGGVQRLRRTVQGISIG